MKILRRSFMLGGYALATLPSFSITRLSSGRKLRIALIGCGARMRSLVLNAMQEEIVAMADPDPSVFAKLFEILKGYGQTETVGKIKTFPCYREMLDKMSGELDAVIGENGAMRIGSGGGLVFAPTSFKRQLGDVPKIFPREKHMTHMKDFFIAARGDRPAVCNVDYSEPLARTVLSGNLASLAGRGRKISL